MSKPLLSPSRMEKIVSLCKRRGFVFPSSEIYGGLNGFWDYGPLGAELKRNVRETWWRAMTRERDDVVGLDATIIMHPAIWKASGHVDTFSDPMVDCLLTQKRLRADHVEPQSGEVLQFAGAIERSYLESITTFLGEEVDLAKGCPLEVARARGKPGRGKTLLSESLEIEDGNGFRTLDISRPQVVSQSIAFLVKKHRETTRLMAQNFYQLRGLKDPILFGERIAHAQGSRAFNPENGAQLTEPVPFNLMFHTFVGATATEEDKAYLRPETAQAIFAQFKNVVDSSRQKVPFGICQVGKAFRNEVTPRNFTFRSREFEQMELEYFIPPDEAIQLLHGHVTAWSEGADLSTPQPDWGWEMWHRYWVAERTKYYHAIGLSSEVLAYHWQKPEELAHYARATVDILFQFPFGDDELEGIAARGDFDLSQHQKFSGKPLEVFDEAVRDAAAKLDDTARHDFTEAVVAAWIERNKSDEEARLFCAKLLAGRYLPHVIEPSAGVDRLILALICQAYAEEEVTDEKGKVETRIVMRFHPRVAPVKCGIFPLLKNKPELVKKALEVRDLLRPHMNVFYDDGGAIGRRYRRQDEAGTPFGITIDFDTIGENGPELAETVTLRHRDSMQQKRVKISELLERLLPQIR